MKYVCCMYGKATFIKVNQVITEISRYISPGTHCFNGIVFLLVKL